MDDSSTPNQSGISRSRRSKSMFGNIPNYSFGPNACVRKSDISTIQIQDPFSQRLRWRSPPTTVLVIKKHQDSSVIEPFCEMLHHLLKLKPPLRIYVERKIFSDTLLYGHDRFEMIKDQLGVFKNTEEGAKAAINRNAYDHIDLIVCLGGDGTLIHVSSLFQQNVPPVAAFNLGSLGFLTSLSFDNFSHHISDVIAGDTPLTLHLRLQGKISNSEDSNNKTIEQTEPIKVLNEVVIDRGPNAYLCHLDVYVESQLVTSVLADGLLVATPTGSTAYAAAAGASMVHPSVPAMIICPICPHSLSFRPIVVPAGVEIKIKLSPDSRNSAWVSFDGRKRQELGQNQSLSITSSNYPLPSICYSNPLSDWFCSLGECLHWNVRKQQKPLDMPNKVVAAVPNSSGSVHQLNPSNGHAIAVANFDLSDS